ncbi:hypothetical protein JL722_14748 [Aureococcus anophagefferens]|nr:hypothetical protein JL722_14748 [Aureococcus anophagefferens]
MPHIIDRDVVGAIQRKYPEPWRETASHRFRSGRDVQYAFAYFHYVMGTFDAAAPDLDELWRVEIDADGSGALDGNEVLTLAAMALGKEPDDAYVDEIYACASSERVGAALRRWWRRLPSPRSSSAGRGTATSAEAYERDAPGQTAAGLAVALAAWGAAAALRRRTTAGAGEDEGKGKAE